MFNFGQGLVSNQDEEIRRRVQNKLGNEPNLTLQQIAEDCEKFVYIRQDSKNFEEIGVAQMKNIRHKKQKKKRIMTPDPCDLHWYKDCLYRTKKCLNCKK